MKILRCRKCGTYITNDDGVVQDLITYAETLRKRVYKYGITGAKAAAMLQQAVAYEKLAKQLIHIGSQMDEDNVKVRNELSILVGYLIDNNLMTYDQIDELREKSRKRADDHLNEMRRQYEIVYGGSKSALVTAGGPTERKAIKNLEGSRKNGKV